MSYSKEDWNAAMSSEVFREYLKAEQQAEDLQKLALPIYEQQVISDFEQFEQKANKSPQIKAAFQSLQKKFQTDPEYTATVDPKFVRGVLLLHLPESVSK